MAKKIPKVLDQTSELLRQIRADIAGLKTELKAEIAQTGEKVGALAQAFVGVQRDVRDLKREMTALVVAVDEHTRRLDRIDEHLGLNLPKH